ncbi:MAG: hypothetical protein HC866_00015 [Leptolyngbyaceae cyanobacterium RU_5_1]|nr:hypothetical protein [Leptolyngbyaceae cyanobacterium RU_5_1]
MRQSSPVMPLTQPARMPLHPLLRNALVNLDSQLENELVRYRRQRTLGKGGYSVRQSDSQKASKPLDSVLETADERPQVSQIIHQSEPFSSDAVAGSIVPDVMAPDLAIVPTTPSASDHQSTPDAPPELQELARQYAFKVAEETDLTESLDPVAPGDYLESSEELLRSLAAEEAEVQTEQRFMQSLLTPMGVGSMLLLLVSSVLFGFVIMNPASLTQLFASRNARFGLNPSDTLTTPSNPDATGAGVLQPNLANQEFPDRLNLETLGSLPVDPNSIAPNPTTKDLPGSASSSKTANLGISGRSNPANQPGSSKTPVLPVPKVNQFAPDPASVVPRKLAPATSYYDAPPATSTSDPHPLAHTHPCHPPVPTAHPLRRAVHHLLRRVPLQRFLPSRLLYLH